MGLTLEFQYQDFYAGIRAGNQLFHLKLVDEKDPSIEFVDKGEHFHLYLETDDVEAAADTLKRNGVRLVKDVHETAWGTREFVIKDDQGIPCTSVKVDRLLTPRYRRSRGPVN